MAAQLTNIVLSEQWLDSNPFEQLSPPSQLIPGLDVDQCTVEIVDASQQVVTVEFSMVLVRAGSDDVVSTMSSTYRLHYQSEGQVNKQALSQQAVRDAWRVWQVQLPVAMTWMGLVPLRLPPSVPEGALQLAKLTHSEEDRHMSGFTLMQGIDPKTARPVLVLFGPEAGRAVVYADDLRHVPHATETWATDKDPWGSHTPQPLTHQELSNLTDRFVG